MIIFHASYVEIPKPDIMHSRVAVDFGRGFYTTPLKEQAEKWARNSGEKEKARL